MVQTVFSKAQIPTATPSGTTFSISKSYVPPDNTNYGWGVESGQRFSIFYPAGKPSDYPDVYPAGQTTWAYVAYVQSSGGNGSDPFTISDAAGSDNSAANLTNLLGLPWQFLMRGIALIYAQTTSATLTVTGSGATLPNGKGFLHVPGGPLGLYEATNTPSAIKDVIHFTQHLQFHASEYKLDPSAWCIAGDSHGSVVSAWTSLHPSRAGELGYGGQYSMNTVPNCAMHFQLAPIANWDHYAAAYNPYGFPLTDQDGTAGDSNTAVTMGAVKQRIKRYFSVPHLVSDGGSTENIPYIFIAANSPSVNANFRQPFVDLAETATLNVHTTYHAYYLKQHFPSRVTFWTCDTVVAPSFFAAVGGAYTKAGIPLTGLYDGMFANHIFTGTPHTGDIIQGSMNDNAYAGLTTGVAIEWLVAHIRAKRWDATIPNGGILRWGQTNQFGRICVPARGDRAGTWITQAGETHQLNFGPSQRAVAGFIPGLTTGSANAAAPASIFYPGNGNVWLSAGKTNTGTPQTGAIATYVTREVARGQE